MAKKQNARCAEVFYIGSLFHTILGQWGTGVDFAAELVDAVYNDSNIKPWIWE